MKSGVAVTGANGYVGGILTEALRNKGYHVHTMGTHAHAGDEAFFTPFHLGEKNDYSILDRMDALIHCAHDFTVRTWEDMDRVNVRPSVELLGEAHKRGVRKIIFISSICAYEQAQSNYGRAKLNIEKQSSAFGTVMVRPGTVFGKNAGSIVGTMNNFVRKHRFIPLIGKGEQIFYSCHAEDLSSLILKLLPEPETPKGPVTAASRETITYKGLMQVLAESNKKKVIFIPIPCALLYAGFAFAEKLGIKMVRGTDSLINLNTPNLHPDFRETERLGIITFRPLTPATLDS